MLDQKFRGQMTSYLSNSKDKEELNLSHDPNKAAFDDMAKVFNDPSYVAPEPKEADEIDYEDLDPNDVRLLVCYDFYSASMLTVMSLPLH